MEKTAAKAPEAPKMRAAIFTNYTDEDFIGIWGKTEYPIPAGQSMMFEGGLAIHFAKQLAQRELNKKNILCSKSNVAREGRQALKVAEVKGKDETQVRNEVLNYNEMKKSDLVKVAKEKGVKINTQAKKADIAKELEEFEGLNEE